MLQFNSTLSHSLTLKLFPYWRLSSLLSTSVVNPEISNSSKQPETTSIQDAENLSKKDKVLQIVKSPQNESSKIPESVKHFQHRTNSKASVHYKIKHAKSTEELLSIMKSPNIMIEHVKEILDLISSKNDNVEQINLSSTDVNGSLTKPDTKKMEADNSIMLSLATPSLIQVLRKLSHSRDRNLPLLKTLAHNITLYSERLNIKMCGDILYSLSILHYFNENLLNKIMIDLLEEIPNNKKSSVMGSIVTSMGLLRYKNCEVLDAISKWTVDNYEMLRIQDIIATLHCFATFGYNPQNMSDLQKRIYSLKIEDMTNKALWLDYVWSLTILDNALPSHISSVLQPAFVEAILKVPKEKYMSKVLKLLNINGAAKVLFKDYNGPFLDSSNDIFSAYIGRGKQKKEYIELLNETLTEVAPLCFQTNVYTKMGFFIDAVCCIDSNNEFVRLENYSQNGTYTRLALMIHDYYDYSLGKVDLLGIIHFYNRVLSANNYKVLDISYHNFSMNDKLIKRVKYLTGQIKFIQSMV